MVFDPIKHVLRVFWTASKTFLEKRVSREFITIMLLWTLEISIREKHDLEFEVSDDVLSNMPLPDYCTDGIENFSRCVFHNCTINLVQK